MALVTYVLGDCPGCGAKDSFGNIDVWRDSVRLGCKRCRYLTDIPLPAIKKKILYLDQFFFSSAYRAGDKRFLEAASRIARLAQLQLLAVPHSSIHEEETHQWEKRDELWEFVKATSRGHEFEAAYNVERTQIVKAFIAWRAEESSSYKLERDDALRDDVDEWDGYLRIDVGRYIGDIDLVRSLKHQSVETLINIFPAWRKSEQSFEHDLEVEYLQAGKGYLDAYLKYAIRVANGDFDALFDSPIMSHVVESLMHSIPKTTPYDERLQMCANFFGSLHFREIPYQWIEVHIYATLKSMVKEGAFANSSRAMERLSGFFFDVKHIASYAPYVDSFIMDQPMAELVARQTIRLEDRYGVQVFSLNNWPDLFAWFDRIEMEGMTEDHINNLKLAYPYLKI